MSSADAVQAGTILALLVVLEGVRRTASDTVVLRRLPWSPWCARRTVRLGAGFQLVSWLVPLSLPVLLSGTNVVADPDAARDTLDAMRERQRRVSTHVRALQLVGTLVAVVLAAGVPYAAWSRGAFGLIVALVALALLTSVQAVVAGLALARAGSGPSPFVRWLWPFTALRAAEAVQERVVAGVPSLLVERELLGDEELLRAHRADLHDAVYRSDVADAVATLLGMERVRAFLAAVPADLGDEGFCARCASRYRPGVADCAVCEVPLVLTSGGVASA